jgi:hypothetical protein
MAQQMINERTFSPESIRSLSPEGAAARRMSLVGTVLKTLVLFVLTCGFAVVGWTRAATVIRATSGPSWLLGYFVLIALSYLAIANPRFLFAVDGNKLPALSTEPQRRCTEREPAALGLQGATALEPELDKGALELRHRPQHLADQFARRVVRIVAKIVTLGRGAGDHVCPALTDVAQQDFLSQESLASLSRRARTITSPGQRDWRSSDSAGRSFTAPDTPRSLNQRTARALRSRRYAFTAFSCTSNPRPSSA